MKNRNTVNKGIQVIFTERIKEEKNKPDGGTEVGLRRLAEYTVVLLTLRGVAWNHHIT
jgi:hypothetical protein